MRTQLMEYQTLVSGRDINANFLVGGIMVTLSPLTVLLAFVAPESILLFALSIAFLSLYYFTSRFVISASTTHLKIQRTFIGIPIRQKSFEFEMVHVRSGRIIFERPNNYLAFHFERKHEDEMEYEINPSFYSIGCSDNASTILKELKSFAEKKNTVTNEN